MNELFENGCQKLGLSFLFTYGRSEPKQRRISVEKLKFSTFLITGLDLSSHLFCDCDSNPDKTFLF